MNHVKHKRRQYVVDPGFQYGMIFRISFVTVLIMAMSLFLLAIVYQMYANIYVDISISQPMPFEMPASTAEKIQQEEEILSLLWPVLAVSLVGTLIITFTFGLILSHRMAGPVRRIREHLRQIGQGDLTGRLKLRPRDSFQELADDLNMLREELRAKVSEGKRICAGEPGAEKHQDQVNRLALMLSDFKTEAEPSKPRV